MPAPVRQQDDPLLGRLLQPPDRVLKDLPLHGLTLPVQLAQLPGQLCRPVRIPGKEQLSGQTGLSHPAGRIDPGGQRIAHGHRGEGPVPQSGLLDQLGKAQPPGMGQGGQSGLNDGAVFAGHGHHIGHRSHRGQVGIFQKDPLRPLRSGHRHGQLQGHTHPSQALEGIGAVGAAGIHHSARGGQALLTLMVVRHHHIHPQRGGERGLRPGGDAAVHSDDQGDPLGRQGGHRLRVEAIPLLQAVWDIGQDPSAQTAQAVGEQTGRGDPVHVVVPVDRHSLPRLQGPADAADRPVHVPQAHRVLQRRLSGGEEGLGLLPRPDPPGGQHCRQKRRDPRLLQLLPGGAAGRGDPPFLITHRASLLPPSAGGHTGNNITGYYTIVFSTGTSKIQHIPHASPLPSILFPGFSPNKRQTGRSPAFRRLRPV